MTNPDLARTLDAVANQMQFVAGFTTELRRSIGADAHTLVDLESAVGGVIRLLPLEIPLPALASMLTGIPQPHR